MRGWARLACYANIPKVKDVARIPLIPRRVLMIERPVRRHGRFLPKDNKDYSVRLVAIEEATERGSKVVLLCCYCSLSILAKSSNRRRGHEDEKQPPMRYYPGVHAGARAPRVAPPDAVS